MRNVLEISGDNVEKGLSAGRVMPGGNRSGWSGIPGRRG
jgi:hypothetical protein